MSGADRIRDFACRLTGTVWTYCRRCSLGHCYRAEDVAPGLTTAFLAHHTHKWSVTHRRSGLGLAFACCQDEARRLGRLLAPLADWTQPADMLRADQGSTVRAMADAGVWNGVTYECVDHEGLVAGSDD